MGRTHRRATPTKRAPAGPMEPRSSARRGHRPSAAARRELETVMQDIGLAFAACICARRFGDLKAAAVEYGSLLGIDAARLLHWVILRQLAQHALGLTDPQQRMAFVPHVVGAYELMQERMSLDEAVGMLEDSARFKPAFDAFDAIDAARDGGVN